jgi:hypothetical protein
MENSKSDAGSPSADGTEALLDLDISDEEVEIASGANSEAVPTLAVGSYCFTCPKVLP